MDKIYLKPTSDQVKVKDPLTRKPLDKDGEFKPNNSYWQRRLRDKDVVQATPPAGAQKPAANTAKPAPLASN